MRNQDAGIRLEEQIALALKSEPEDWTPDCLAPEQMIALVERALLEGEAAPLLAHVALCARCRREYTETVELFQLSEEIRVLEAQNEQAQAAVVVPSPAGVVSHQPPPEPSITPILHQPKQPALWERWLAPQRRIPALGFALGMAAACGILFVVNKPHPVEKVVPDGRDLKLAALTKELDAQTTRADRSEQERQRLEKAIAAIHRDHSEAARLAKKIAGLKGQVTTQGIQIARLNDAAITLRQLPLPTAAWLSQENSQLRGNGGTDAPATEIALLRPINAAVVTTRPILECRPVAGATNYQISLEGESTNIEISAPKPLSATRWQPQVPLTPGTVYKWEVTAQRRGEPIRSQTVKFYILSASEQHAVVAARQKYAHSPMALGAVYARTGLREEAAQQFRAALKTNPSQEVARRWLREIAAQHKQ